MADTIERTTNVSIKLKFDIELCAAKKQQLPRFQIWNAKYNDLGTPKFKKLSDTEPRGIYYGGVILN